MQIVIDIPEETYKGIMLGKWDKNGLAYYVKVGTPLPKGHGRLIDADAFVKKYERDKGRRIYVDNFIFDLEMNTPTIIEAESEETEIIKCHGKQITVPKGTFEKIMNEEEVEDGI